jgi:hypothetical protein
MLGSEGLGVPSQFDRLDQRVEQQQQLEQDLLAPFGRPDHGHVTSPHLYAGSSQPVTALRASAMGSDYCGPHPDGNGRPPSPPNTTDLLRAWSTMDSGARSTSWASLTKEERVDMHEEMGRQYAMNTYDDACEALPWMGADELWALGTGRGSTHRPDNRPERTFNPNGGWDDPADQWPAHVPTAQVRMSSYCQEKFKAGQLDLNGSSSQDVREAQAIGQQFGMQGDVGDIGRKVLAVFRNLRCRRKHTTVESWRPRKDWSRRSIRSAHRHVNVWRQHLQHM